MNQPHKTFKYQIQDLANSLVLNEQDQLKQAIKAELEKYAKEIVEQAAKSMAKTLQARVRSIDKNGTGNVIVTLVIDKKDIPID